MENSNLKKAGILTLMLVLTSMGSWEFYLRSKGVSFSFDDNEALWAYKRAQIYEHPDATFFIGSSRIKFDIDLPTWEKITGQKAMQLALVGTSPQFILKDLADDKKFKGKLIIDGTEFILFSRDPGDQENAKKSIEYYKKITPAQRAGFYIDYLLQSGFVLLESKKFSLNGILDRLPIPERKGVPVFRGFPIGFEPTTFDRQNVMSDDFVKDTTRQWQVKNAWIQFGAVSSRPGIKGDSLLNIFKDLKISIDKIKARGGQVIFLRPPSSGAAKGGEKIAYPRNIYWDKLLEQTNTDGIYFEDYPEIAAFECPEWSHLSQAQAIIFTKNIVQILRQQKGWTFPYKQTTALNNVNSKNF
ncbi:MAG TPA: hypothetical protein VMY77_04970 [Chitinophagaceae bacterium]|nr:hypothetical protein [Chitinophagaceae bacterium]